VLDLLALDHLQTRLFDLSLEQLALSRENAALARRHARLAERHGRLHEELEQLSTRLYAQMQDVYVTTLLDREELIA
jgi:hypothetical protein